MQEHANYTAINKSCVRITLTTSEFVFVHMRTSASIFDGRTNQRWFIYWARTEKYNYQPLIEGNLNKHYGYQNVDACIDAIKRRKYAPPRKI